ncbi:MAG: outer membrane protein assembly factor BamD [Bacteroidota bacterium]|nr:outer membrane protein assembly factor BamD [bacterium]NBP63296.1 outer membrane protein assembly factor BamD [Bacteroidota bacterium]
MKSNLEYKIKSNRSAYLLTALYCSVMLLLTSCSGVKTAGEIMDAETAYNAGVKAFLDEDYFEAQRLFDVIRLQFPTTQYADDAQFYLGEISFAKKEYVMAAFNFGMVRRSYPSSPLNKTALYKTAMCYYELSPPADRDQDYTKKAIASFSEFQAIFPLDSLYNESGKKINELRNRLAERELITAELYRSLYSNRSAIIYYDAIIDDYPDTEHYETAFAGKIESLIALRRYDDAKSMIDVYKKRFVTGRLRSNVETSEQLLPH